MAVDRPKSAAGDLTNFWMISAARRPASLLTPGFALVPASVSSRMLPPAELIRPLIQTM
jgi:hypothetical protein